MSSTESRFWDKVLKGDGCWEWMAAKDRFGRGRFKWNGKTSYSPRYSWEVNRGVIPEGLFVLHKCENPGCVNPDHLFLGTKGDNNRDRKSKGRGADLRGSNNPSAIIDESVALEIINLLNSGASLRSIRDLGYSWNCAQNIKYMKAWSHLPGAGGWKEGSAHDRSH